ncbi:type II transport protein GspH [mine drainage metagenome]|uniref:Type II transport protein GspH n=1 Tax=mine drainage metagenome TaxID=410659 RepID=A0A1J5QSU5_9ZZZZ
MMNPLAPSRPGPNGCRSAPWYGFTLVEMMVVLAVFAILLGIASPSYTSMIANMRVRTAASDFVADLAYARAQAISLRGRIGVAGAGFASGWTVFRECHDANADGACQDAGEAAEIASEVGVLDANDEILRTHPALHSSVLVCAKNSAGSNVVADTITYGGDGRLRVYSAGTEVQNVAGILFTSPAMSSSGGRKVLLSPAGRVSVDAAVNPGEGC